jgi:hypothetical protein
VEALFVTIDVLEREVRMFGVEQRQSKFAVAAPFVDEVLSGFKGAFVFGHFGFCHVHHPEDAPDTRLERPARVVWPEDRTVALVLVTVERGGWIAHNPIVHVQE